jgi:hypothetical protein
MIGTTQTVFFKGIIKNLTHHLDAQNLSALIGAGFSKNVNDELFPSWWQLLEKMVLQMHEKEYERTFKEKTGLDPKRAKRRYGNFVKEKVDQYIDKEGYLQTVSQFIAKMGYRETVEIYIEEHTPIAKNEDGKKYLYSYENGSRSKKNKIIDSDLQVHENLLRLPWSNIFTTNYDNLLEFFANNGENLIDKLSAEYEEQQRQIDKKIREKQEDQQKLERIIRDKTKVLATGNTGLHKTKGYSELDSVSEEQIIPTTGQGEDNATNPSTESIEELDKKIQKLARDISGLERRKEGISRKITDLRSGNWDNYNIVTRSSQLGIRRTRNIIKLHGTIRQLPEDPFCFDNDYNKCYVISKEDYEEYPHKHEAFTQLMRISLLQGHFCLFGFSGDDPNFKAWLKWVRDVVTKPRSDKGMGINEAEQNNTGHKIYLIDVKGASFPTAHREQFYRNHHIAYVPLSHPDCLAYLEERFAVNLTGATPKNILTYFLKELEHGKLISEQKAASEIKFRELYENYYSKFNYDREDEVDVLSLYREFEAIKPFKRFVRLPSVDFQVDYGRRELIRKLEFYLSGNLLNNGDQEKVYKMLAHVLWDMYARPSNVLEDFQVHVQNTKAVSNSLNEEFLALELWDAVWLADENKVDELYNKLSLSEDKEILQRTHFLLALFYHITFQWKERDKVLDDWSPADSWIILRSAFLFYSEPEKATQIIKSFHFPTLQEELYGLELQMFIPPTQFPFKNQDRINNLRAAELRSIYDNFKPLIDNAKAKEEDIKPLGADRYQMGSGIRLSNVSEDLQSLQYFGLLMMSGFPLKLGHINIHQSKKIFPIIKRALHYAPIPVLFYGLQYQDNKLLKRLGQEYAAATAIDEDQPQIVSALSNAIFTVRNGHFRTMALAFLSEYLNVMDQTTWTEMFKNIWKTWPKETLFKNDHLFDEDIFKSALGHLTDSKLMAIIISDCLEDLYKKDIANTNATDFLYRLSRNPFLKKNSAKIKKQLKNGVIENLMESLKNDPHKLFIVGYIHSLLAEEMKTGVLETIRQWDMGLIRNARIWSVISFYIKQDNDLQRKVISAVIQHPALWDSGIRDNSIHGGVDFVPIRKLRRGKGMEHGLQFSKEEVVALYNKLEFSLKKIEELGNKRRGIVNFRLILQEMVWFLEDEERNLEDEPEYKQVLQIANKIFMDEKDGLDLISGLLSDTVEGINWAIMEVSRNLYDNEDFRGFQRHIDIVVNRILLKSKVGLELCLEYFTVWLYNFRDQLFFKTYIQDVYKILCLYKDNIPETCTPSYVEAMLVRMAFVMEFWQETDDVTRHYLNLLENSRYNSTKYILKEKLATGEE